MTQTHAHEATATPAYLQHEDTRVAAVLALAHLAAEYDYHQPTLAVAAAAIVPSVDAKTAHASFMAIVGDLEESVQFDTRGADAVREVYGRWNDTLGMDADDKASELRDERRASARFHAEMLVTTHDNLRERAR